MRVAILAVLLLTVCGDVHASNRDIEFRHVSLEEGLSQANVYAIAQDHKGFMWFATFDGLNRYDGYEITVYRHVDGDRHSLSADRLTTLYVDSFGVLWVGTKNGGLNRYDSARDRFDWFQHDPAVPTSLSNNGVRVIFEDRRHNLWIGTEAGLNRLDRSTNRFVRYQHDPADATSLSNNYVHAVFEDHQHVLWIGTDAGLDRLDYATERFEHFQHDPAVPTSLNHNTVRVIFEDGRHNLWIGTDTGLNRLDRSTNRFVRFRHDPADSTSLRPGPVVALGEDSVGNLWIGTDGGGLNRYDSRTDRFFHFLAGAGKPGTLNDNRILSILRDEGGVVWVGTWTGGANYFDSAQKEFVHHQHDSDIPNSLSNDGVYEIHEDSLGALWIGTADGLNLLDRESGTFTTFRNDPKNENSLSSSRIWSIAEDRRNPGTALWVGTNQGLNLLDLATNSVTRYLHDPKNPNSPSSDKLYCLTTDSRGDLWIGTEASGVTRYDTSAQEFVRYRHDANDSSSLSGDEVYAIHEGPTGTIWIGTNHGLSKYERATDTFRVYKTDPSNPHSLSEAVVTSIYEDRSGVVWVGTERGRLNRLDPSTHRFTHFLGMTKGVFGWIYGILQDKRGNLWLSHNKGLAKFNPTTREIRHYDVTDGLQSNEFNLAFCPGKDGVLHFGGINGFNSFDPAAIVDNPYAPPIVITDLRLFNESVPIGRLDDGDAILTRSITETHSITLSHKDKVFSFAFTALHFANPNVNEYAYIMEGFENEWNYVGSRRFATYTNLPPGNYTFRVKASNGDGVWNEEGTSVQIKIVPPFWQTAWFRILAIAIFGIGLFTVYRMRLAIIEAQRARLEREVVARTSELATKKRELEQKARDLELANKYKSEFLANMSHELRTPLNSLLILARMLADNDKGNLTEEQVESAEIIHGGGTDLLSLINDILDLSKVEAGKLELDVDRAEIDDLILRLQEGFKAIAEQKGVEFVVQTAPGVPAFIQTDTGRVGQILKNLLSNAFKFTEQGSVTLRIDLPHSDVRFSNRNLARDQTLAFSVIDTGIGIPEDRKRAVFEAFQQADGGTSRKYGGTGLGLSISRELTCLLGGEIQMESQPGKGSRFTLYLPTGEPQASEQEEPSAAMVEVAAPRPKTPPPHPSTRSRQAEAAVAPQTRPFVKDDRGEISNGDKTFLIIEDDAAFAEILVNLSHERGYKCIATPEGASAWQLCSEIKPTAVLLDLGLPDMEGLRVLAQLKHNLDTRHIPVHIISGRDDPQAALQDGAIGFLTKPASMESITAAFAKIESVVAQKTHEVLVVQPNNGKQGSVAEILENSSIKVTTAGSGTQALETCKGQRYDCIVVDDQLSDMTALEIVEKMSSNGNDELPPTIVYSQQPLDAKGQLELCQRRDTSVVKRVCSREQVLDKTTLFLHSVDASLSAEQQQIMRMLHDPDRLMQGRKILLVDDDMRNTFSLSKVLRDRGLRVVMADNGQTALERLEHEDGVDLVIMDIMMPVMDGYEATRRIRGDDRFSRLPVVALTAKAMAEDRAKCLEAGADDYLTKPVNVETLLSILRVWLFEAACDTQR